MKEIFPGYSKKSPSELQQLWETSFICFDTNVLLNLYRYSQSTRKAFIELIKEVKGKVWLTHQAALEYNRNRYEVISEQEKTYKDFLNKIEEIERDLQSKNKPPFLTDSLYKSLSSVFKDVKKEVAQSINDYSAMLNQDATYEELNKIFQGKISDPYTEKELEEIYKEGKTRYENQIPPGYEDEKKSDTKRKFGDLVLWKQILDKAKKEKKSVILITDERKNDWWWRLKDGRNIGPRQELVEEMKRYANADFHMYSSERFLSFGQESLKVQVNPRALEEIAELKKSESTRIEIQELLDKKLLAKKAEKEKQEQKLNYLLAKLSRVNRQLSENQAFIEEVRTAGEDSALPEGMLQKALMDYANLRAEKSRIKKEIDELSLYGDDEYKMKFIRSFRQYKED